MVTRMEAVVAWWGLVVACSSGSGPATGGVTAAQACADNAHQRCIQLQSCSATDLQLRYGSESDCETRETASCTTALSEPLNGNTPTAVEACAGAYAGWACADYLDGQNVPPPCRQQLGPVVNGGSCAIDGQCQSGFCGVAPGSACGTCEAVPAVGASCARLTSCGPGLACTTDTATCVVFGVRGSACGEGAVCGVGLSCVGADAATGTQGTCQRAGATVGAACDPTTKTAAGCDRNAGVACNSTSRTCRTVVVASSGDPCGNAIDGQPAYCEADGACSGASATMPGACTAAAADGDPCDTAAGPGCVIPARCIGDGGTAGTCQYSGAQLCPP
jgi:hypothetical protein